MSILKMSYSIEELQVRRQRSLLRLMYNESKIDANLAIVKVHMTLRSDKKVKLKSDFTRLTKIQKSPFYRGQTLWNNLPAIIQNEPSTKLF